MAVDDQTTAPQQHEEQQEAQPSGLRSFIAGGVGGMALVLVGHPLDTIKVNVQNFSGNISTMQAAKNIYSSAGFRGFYRGMAAPLAGVAPIFALSFLGYNVGKSIFCDDDAIEKEKYGQLAAGGFMATFFTTPIMAPGERVKCILQTQHASTSGKKYNGSLDAIKDLYKTGGLRSANRGFTATLLRDGCGSAVYFAGYELMKKRMAEANVQPVLATFLAGGFAGMINWAIILPIDTVKTRFQIGNDPSYMSVLRGILRESGVRGLFRGLTAVMLRAFPANAACFAGYELAMHVTGQLGMK